MIEKRRAQQSPQHDAIGQPLLELHDALLHLHKVSLDSERAVYEATVGPIHSPNHFFQLLTGDPWFAWLRPISQLIRLTPPLEAGTILWGFQRGQASPLRYLNGGGVKTLPAKWLRLLSLSMKLWTQKSNRHP